MNLFEVLGALLDQVYALVLELIAAFESLLATYF